MWDLPGPGLEPVSPALAGGFLTTAPPGKPHKILVRIKLDNFMCGFSWWLCRVWWCGHMICLVTCFRHGWQLTKYYMMWFPTTRVIWKKGGGNFNGAIYGTIEHMSHRHAAWCPWPAQLSLLHLRNLKFSSWLGTATCPREPSNEFLIRVPLMALWSQMTQGLFLPEFHTIPPAFFFPGKIY